MTLGKFRRFLYALAKWLGDVQAVRQGPKAMGTRVLRRAVGKATGRLLGQLFR
jgi:hypothetical protein